MTDIAHNFGSDLVLGPTGDLAVATGVLAGQQRVLRRLLTPASSYIWHTSYGGGLGAYVGQANPGARVRGVAQQQMRKEAAVARNPVPLVTVATTAGGTLTLSISYSDAATATPVTLTTPVT